MARWRRLSSESSVGDTAVLSAGESRTYTARSRPRRPFSRGGRCEVVADGCRGQALTALGGDVGGDQLRYVKRRTGLAARGNGLMGPSPDWSLRGRGPV